MPRKRKKSAAAKENDDDFTRLFFGQSDNAKFRHGLYNQTWQKIEAKMKELQKQVFDTVVSDVINFCQKNSGNERQQRREDVLPTCALVTGVNLPDHKDFFKLLGRAIKKSSTKHVATVKSSDCSTIKLLVKKILAQLQKVRLHLRPPWRSACQQQFAVTKEGAIFTKQSQMAELKWTPRLII